MAQTYAIIIVLIQVEILHDAHSYENLSPQDPSTGPFKVGTTYRDFEKTRDHTDIQPKQYTN